VGGGALVIAELCVAFGDRLRAAGVPVTPERSARFADALSLTQPESRTRLYWSARAVLVSDQAQVTAFNDVFFEVFGGVTFSYDAPEDSKHEFSVPDDRAASAGATGGAPGGASPAPGEGDADNEAVSVVPVMASDEERLRGKHFDALEPGELAQLYRLMTEFKLAAPVRRTRRAKRDRHGEHIDLRRTLRGALRTGGDPVHLRHKRRHVERRRIVLLCDISGSMEPYSRAFLQFLTCAGKDAEAFVFATRLTRITRQLASRSPDQAIRRAAAAAPDWSSSTRIGDALKRFNDRHGRRGMARGAVVVILSDGWERGDPALVEREMERLARLAYRIVWVNPRAAAAGFSPQVGGMAAALPHIDALISGHNLEAMHEVIEEIGSQRTRKLDAPEAVEENWASATPVAGSSVAMPSGYSPSRGKTSPGWILH
jgi:uncharacterized protein with von Willebrand factor type A (vWA) domain